MQAWSFVGQLCMCSKWALPCVCVCVWLVVVRGGGGGIDAEVLLLTPPPCCVWTCGWSVCLPRA